jgi:hypothetical protein
MEYSSSMCSFSPSPEALDYMRCKFEENPYFTDELEGQPEEYIATNIFGVATEREFSVLERGLPVYRSVFRRNDRRFQKLGSTFDQHEAEE